MASSLTTLIERAREAAVRFDSQARKPIVVEFAGCPKAGKTSTIGQIASFFKRSGFKVDVVVERASVSPIRDKKHFNFNVWTGCTTLAQLLEKTQDPPRDGDPQLLILDRGIFDSVCWLRQMERSSRIRPADRQSIENFLLIDDWRKRLSGVVLMLASPDDSMEREKGDLPIPNAKGSIMNAGVLAQMRQTNEETAKALEKHFRVMSVDTSASPFLNDKKKTCEMIATTILDWVEEHITEDILFLPVEQVRNRFGASTTISVSNAESLVTDFSLNGQFLPRDQVEDNAEYVQALPVAVVRNAAGQILRLRRRERDKSNSLNEKTVLWAGGHVRKEDRINGDTLKYALIRELHEELRLEVDKNDLALLGCVYTPGNGRSAKHVAVVYEWRAKTDDVSVTLNSAEFIERRGNSVSGTFVSIAEIVTAIDSKSGDSKEISESWSVEIVRKLLQETLDKKTKTLF